MEHDILAQQNHKIKIFSMGDIVIWFPMGRKENTKKIQIMVVWPV